MIAAAKNKFIQMYCRVMARHHSKSTYPESLSIDLGDLLTASRPIRVAIIDDKSFPWKDALENRGCKVTYYSDYTKPIRQANQRLKSHDLSSQDIIICDIHGVGSALYPGVDGIGVMEELRRKNPLHVIAAYTGNPGAIYTKMKRQDALDMVFSRDWEIDDFLFNFDELAKIFSRPKQRWDFIRKRLVHLEVNEQKINEIRKLFVENVLLGQMLKQRFRCDASETKSMMLARSSRSFDFAALAKFGVGAADLAALVSPFVLDAIK